ncbi:hypothetical protein DFH11DRAFT_1640102 [Phellopilus nigrolimitatus]|nr:hypothetical protein DFH11DRAFT_1640102 [Phellopilus nigrolimitatus]
MPSYLEWCSLSALLPFFSAVPGSDGHLDTDQFWGKLVKEQCVVITRSTTSRCLFLLHELDPRLSKHNAGRRSQSNKKCTDVAGKGRWDASHSADLGTLVGGDKRDVQRAH